MTVPPALDPDALLAKSTDYVRRALRRKDEDDLDEYQLWASLALELLGKAALARAHPCLIADPNHAPSLFAAAGRPYDTDIKTITAKTLFSRLRQMEKRFDANVEKFCTGISERRNAELHSGDVPFRAMKLETWEGRFWHAADLVLRMQDRSLADWLGTDRSGGPDEIVVHAREARRSAAELRLESATTAFKDKKKAERDDLLAKAAVSPFFPNQKVFEEYYEGTWTTVCPACGGRAYAGGDQIDEFILEPDHDYGAAWETVELIFSPQEFRCPVCDFHAEGFDELDAVGLAGEHHVTTEREMEYEPDYGND